MEQTKIYGRNPVREAILRGINIEKIYLLNTIRGEFEVEIRNKCIDNNIPLSKVPDEKLSNLSKTRDHQGIVAAISPVRFTTIEKLLPELLSEGITPLFLVLENITDVRNMGAIARSAKVFGAHALVVQAKGSAAINSEMIKASAGAILNIPVCRENSLLVALETLQQNDMAVYATDLSATKTIAEVDLKSPTAIVLGSEDKGVSKKTLMVCDEAIKIPQAAAFDSLNVSVAAGIILYEVMLQRV